MNRATAERWADFINLAHRHLRANAVQYGIDTERYAVRISDDARHTQAYMYADSDRDLRAALAELSQGETPP